MAVANQRLIPENHEKYYREMLTGGAIQDGDVPNIEDTARWASDYFWATLYTPYADVERIAPLMRERVEESLRLLMTDDANGLRQWMTTGTRTGVAAQQSRYDPPGKG